MAQSAHALTIPQRLERLPLTGFQRKLFLIIATAWLFDSIDLAMLTFVLAPIAKEFRLSAGQTGILASSSFAGMLVGAAMAGYLADRYGRKTVFQWSMVIWGAASILCAAAHGPRTLALFRFLLGFGMGAEFPIAQSIVSEIIPASDRGRYVAFLEGFWPLGFIAAGILAYFLVPVGGWRLVFVVEGIPAAFVYVIRRTIPESPRWYETRGRQDKAEETMRRLEEDIERAYGRPLPAPSGRVYQEAAHGDVPLRELFTPQYRARTAMSLLMWFCILLGYYGITTWLGGLLVAKGFSVVKSIQFILLMTLWGVPGFYSAAYAVERLGRRPGLTTYVILSALFAYLYGQAASYAQLYIAGALMQFFFFGMWSALYAYTPELFPTRARATGCGLSSAAGRLGALIGPAVVPLVLSAYKAPAVFTLGALSFLVAAAVVLTLGPETKQRVLEEIAV